MAESVRLAWDPNPDRDVSGYYVYRSLTSGGPYLRLSSGLVKATYYVDNAAEPGKTYYYAVTAANAVGLESAFSLEAQITLGKFDLVPRQSALVARTMPDITATPGQLVMLSGSGHNPENKNLSYLWTQILGPAVPITGKTRADASFMAPFVAQETLLSFSFYVTDNDVTVATDTLQIAIRPK